jgi:hypothetical protein
MSQYVSTAFVVLVHIPMEKGLPQRESFVVACSTREEAEAKIRSLYSCDLTSAFSRWLYLQPKRSGFICHRVSSGGGNDAAKLLGSCRPGLLTASAPVLRSVWPIEDQVPRDLVERRTAANLNDLPSRTGSECLRSD